MDLSKISLIDIKNELDRREKCKDIPYKSIIMLGSPGSGKGTQAEILANDLCYCRFSSGDIFRNHVKNKTPMGLEAKVIMDKGELLSDELAYKMLNIKETLNSEECKFGIVFDGFPRTINHTIYLDKVMKEVNKSITNVVVLEVNDEVLINRVSGRLVHLGSGRVYHEIYNPPKVKGKDDITGEDLIKRTDENAIRKRIETYNSETKPLLEKYKSQLIKIKGDDSISNVTLNIKNSLGVKNH